MASFTERIIGAGMLDVRTYEEVEADKGALGQALTIVVLHSVSAGLGAILSTGVMGIIVAGVTSLIGWFLWAFVIYLIGTKLLPEPQTRSDMGELLRTIGFASAPGLLLFLGMLPVVGSLISLGISLWMLAAMVIAVRQALDYRSTGRAIGVCVLGMVAYMMTIMFLSALIAAPFLIP